MIKILKYGLFCNFKVFNHISIGIIKRFWKTLKYEDIYPKSYKTIKEARNGINEYMNIYNTKRIHSAISYKTPDEVYNMWIKNYNIKTKNLLQNEA